MSNVGATTQVKERENLLFALQPGCSAITALVIKRYSQNPCRDDLDLNLTELYD